MKWFAEYFIGILFIVVGVAAIGKSFFNIGIPMFRLIVGTMIVLFGLSVIFIGFGFKNDRDIIFENGNIVVTDASNEYNIIFSRGKVDLSGYVETQKVKNLKINVLFGDGTIIISDKHAVVLNANAVFALAKLPDQSEIIFGSRKYQSRTIEQSEPHLNIEANVVFGRMEIEEY